MKKVYVNTVAVIAVVALILFAIITIFKNNRKQEQIVQSIINPEILRSLTYEQVDDKAEEDSDFVKFVAFFTRDLDNDGYAEKLKGTCRDVKESDELYIEFNVLTDGYLKNGRITLNAPNFTWNTALVSDNIVQGNYVGSTTYIKLIDQVYAGTQKLFLGTIKSDIGNNINNYSKEATITLTGTHVSDDGVETPVNKTTKVIVDWHGDVGARIEGRNVNKKIEDIKLNENDVIVDIDLITGEPKGKMLLKENVITAIIPKLNGYDPLSVTTTGDYIYDEETRVLTARKNSEVNVYGTITSVLPRYNTYPITIQYPAEAYAEENEEMTLEIPLSTYYVAYNNQSEEFENPITSQIAKDIVVVKYAKKNSSGGSAVVIDAPVKDEYEITVGKDGREGYYVSKENPYLIYNEAVEEITEDYYTVKWSFSRGNIGEVSSVIMKETPEKYTDEFLDTSDNHISMLRYTDNIGIYFSGAGNLLGDEGYINVYNDETNELIHTFTKDDWANYDSHDFYKYETPIKHIRIETSATVKDKNFGVYNVKNINDGLLTQEISKEDFEELAYVYSYLTGRVTYSEQASSESVNKIGIAEYSGKKALATISTENSKIETKETTNNYKIYINTYSLWGNDIKWKNGQFIVKLPQEIILTQINDVNINKSNVEILGYELFEEEGCQFIKIITDNQDETTYKITIDCNITPDPAAKTSTNYIELYAYNEIGNGYYNDIEDKYDINSNENVQEKVGFDKTSISFIAQSGLVTSQYISNYNDESTIKIAPNIVNILDGQKTANINLFVLNNYTVDVGEVKVQGVIPQEGNSYVVNRSQLGSKFSVSMNENGIQIPEELEDIVTVYYSEKINPTKDLYNSENGWKLNPDDWSKVKSYLIDFNDYIINAGKSYTFSYGINIPENVEYNEPSYSEHAVYFTLPTKGGKLPFKTEPSKLGLRVIKYCDMELIKHKKNFENLLVKGATYKLEYVDLDGNTNSKFATTNDNGYLSINNLYVGVQYSIKEIREPSKYILNDEILSFKLVKDEYGNINIETENSDKVTYDSVNNIVKIKTDDKPNYSLIITKKDKQTGEIINLVNFKFLEKTYVTDIDGQIKLENLKLNQTYTLQEKARDGYYNLEDVSFKLIEDEGTLKMISNNSELESISVIDNGEEELTQVYATLTNEKIPTYDLQIVKVEENDNVTDLSQLTKLPNTKFDIELKDLGRRRNYITDSNGCINLDNLYSYVDGKNITGEYSIQEIEAPNGYENKKEKISFKVTKNSNGALTVDVENRSELTSLKDIIINGNNITIVVQDAPAFMLIKTDDETGEYLPNVEFIIYEINEAGDIIDFAKDGEQNYVGEKNDKNEYIVKTDENGKIILPLRNGLYKAVEVKYPDGYEKSEDYYFSVGAGNKSLGITDPISTTSYQYRIYYIEDLVDIANNSRNGNTYSGRTVKLLRDLDFNNPSSYRNPESTSYGDINDDKTIQGLIYELTTENGFKQIDNFQGTFDGNGHSIDNYHSIKAGWRYENEAKPYHGGLFGSVSNGKIINLTMSSNESVGHGLIADRIENSVIDNCHTSGGTFNGFGYRGPATCGGIIGFSDYSTIRNCSNNCVVRGHYAGGIVYSIYNSTVINCCNKADMMNDDTRRDVFGGIANTCYSNFSSGASNSKIISCYNEGNFYGGADSVAGIFGFYQDKSCSDAKIEIIQCYNTGNLYVRAGAGIAGISNSGINEIKITDCYNLGDIACSIRCAGICYGSNINDSNFENLKIENCYNACNLIVGGNTEFDDVGPIFSNYKFTSQENKQKFQQNISTNYYLNSSVIKGTIVNLYGTPVSSRYMKSEEFYNELNSDGVWIYIKDSYPKLKNGLVVEEKTQLDITNAKKGYYITSEVASNSQNKRIGGTITGIYNTDYPEQDFIKYIEKVKHSNNSTEKIEIKPDDNYKISEILINGTKIDVSPDEDGNVILNEGYFENVVEDKHIVVVFEMIEKPKIIITKVDEENNNIKISGVKFKVYKNNIFYSEAEEVNIVSGNPNWTGEEYSGGKGVDNANDLNFKFILENDTDCIFETAGRWFNGRTFKLEIDGNEFGTYKDISTKNEYDRITIDLGTIQAGNHKIRISTSSGYAPIYDYFTIKKVETCVETDENGEAEAIVPEIGTYEILEIEAPEEYVADTSVKNVEISSNENKEITITNKKKSYKITTKVERASSQTEDGGTISGKDEQPYESVNHKNDSIKDILITPDEGYIIQSIKINNNEIDFTTDETGKVLLDKFKSMTEDKLVVVRFRKINPNSNLKIVKVDENNSEIKLSGAKFKVEQSGKDLLGELTDSSCSETTHHFVKNGDVYESTNAGVDNSVASSYIPIDLSELTDATIDIRIDVKISSESEHDYGFLDITDSPEVPDYRNSDDKISGNRSMYYTSTLECGYINYLHFCYVKDEANSANNDKFSITNISITLTYPEITTNLNGEAEISVFSGIDTKIKELKAPSEYELDETTHNVVVERGEKKELIISNKKGFVIKKIDETTNEPLPGVQFVIYNLTVGGDFAKDKTGNYIGEINENGLYVVTTNEKGEIIEVLPAGSYKAVEVKGTDQYFLPEKEEDRTIYFKISKGENVQIDTIEDLIDLSNNVINGNSYYGRTISLNRDLDFNDINSYRSYENKTIDEIKADLGIDENGFNPIGLSKDDQNRDIVADFEGIFEGNGHTINNFYSKSSYGSLFSSVKNGAIRNLNLTNVNSTSSACGAAIVRNAENSIIINCSVSGELYGKSTTGGSSPVGGIIYEATDCNIINCSNSAKVEGVYACGIASFVTNCTINHCSNTGEIISTSSAGGIAYKIENSTISNSYNTAPVSGSGCTGGIASSINDSNVTNCYNTGKITDSAPAGGIAYSTRNTDLTNVYNSGEVISSSAPAGGFAQSISGGKIYNCYNAGNVSGKYGAGGIAQSISNVEITNVYNTGDVISSDSNSAGIGTYISSTQITNCYNNGQISGKNEIGGIAYSITNNSKLTKCANKASIEAPSTGVGGIAYNASNSTFEECYNSGNLTTNPGSYGLMQSATNCKINHCYNLGNLSARGLSCGLINTGTNSYLENSFNVGEIQSSVPASGLIYSASGMVVNNCYNIGNVSGQYGVSAIVNGIQSNSTTYINNCYNIGKITNSSQYGGSYIIGGSDYTNVSNLYYLSGTASYGVNGQLSATEVTSKTENQMKSTTFVNQLNSNKDSNRAYYPGDNWKYNAGGYPTLDFEIEDIEVNFEIPEIEELNLQQVSEKRFKTASDELTINNSKKATVYVHHLLEGSTPEDPIKLAPDETIEGKENHDYITAPRIDIEGYDLIKNENGEYIIPENASGKFTLEAQDVYYYYNVKPLELIVHHYLEGTEDKLAEDEHYYYNENEHYKTNPSEEVLKAYDVVLVVGEEEKDITENEEVIYFYKQKEYKITTRVEIPEDEANEGRTEKGGTILGEGETPYETVKHGENSVKDINATPNEGYKLLSITVNGEVIPYEVNEGIISINKFENMTEDKEVVVKYTPIVGKVITHHYLQGTTQKLHDDVINIDKVGETVTTEPVEIKGYKLVGSEGNKDENGNVVIVKEISEGVEEIIYYYQASYIITTDVIEHTEKYKDGTVKNNVKGGSITDEDVVVHELIVKYEQNEKTIEMKPNTGYEISKIVINGNVITSLEPDDNGKVIIPAGYFKNVQQNIHVEVEYRAVSKVIVKYLEDGTENEISDSTQISGYEGKEFETSSKNIPGYIIAKVPVTEGSAELTDKITDENNNKTNPNGTMFSDDITIVYWYQKIDAGVVERHIETNAKGEETLLDIVIHNDPAGTNIETNRKEYSECVSTNAPQATKEFIENNYSNVTLVDKSKDKLTVTSSADGVKEVWYYYVKQYNITTEVKKHEETKNGQTVYVEGGSISKQYEYDSNGNEVETTFELIENRADSTKEIKMTPDNGYIIKSVSINDEELFIDNLINEDGSLTLPVGYFKDVKQDYHVVVEYEKVPAKVIVKYIDDYTKESIIPDKVIDGFVTDEYNEPRVELDGYISVEPEPENYQGNMTEDTITVIYYYQKQFKITTDVIEHYEDKDENIIDVSANKNDVEKEKVLVKGGSIQGEDENPYEAVLRGNDNTKEILIKPDSGYRIKSLVIKDGELEHIFSVADMVKEDNTIVLPVSYFKNMQADKHITVEFERIPSKVIVKYIEKDTEDPVASTENAEGFVGNKYVTHPKEVLNYELINDELPENAEGKLTENDTIVIYYYKKKQKPVEPRPGEPTKPEEPEIPDKPGKPDVPTTPEEPNTPEEPMVTDDSSQSAESSNKNKNEQKSPQTGDNIFKVTLVGVLAVIIYVLTKKRIVISKKFNKCKGKHFEK